MGRLLTVAIPTYNRRPFITALVEELAGAPVDTLVIDDASSDGTSDALSQLPGVTLCRNPLNLGFAPTFLRLFEEVTTPYLLLMSDDDLLVIENLEPLQQFVSEREPAFVSTQYFRDGKLWRGKTERVE